MRRNIGWIFAAVVLVAVVFSRSLTINPSLDPNHRFHARPVDPSVQKALKDGDFKTLAGDLLLVDSAPIKQEAGQALSQANSVDLLCNVVDTIFKSGRDAYSESPGMGIAFRLAMSHGFSSRQLPPVPCRDLFKQDPKKYIGLWTAWWKIHEPTLLKRSRDPFGSQQDLMNAVPKARAEKNADALIKIWQTADSRGGERAAYDSLFYFGFTEKNAIAAFGEGLWDPEAGTQYDSMEGLGLAARGLNYPGQCPKIPPPAEFDAPTGAELDEWRT